MHVRGLYSTAIAAVLLGVSLAGCASDPDAPAGEADPQTRTESAALTTTTLFAVFPTSVTARSIVTGVPSDTDLISDINTADFDASYIQGGATTQSTVDFAYPVPAGGDGPVSQVNVKYFARNSACTAAGLCGKVSTQLLSGTTVLATSASHDLPSIEQGWFMYADTFNVGAGQLSGIANLRTRLVFSHFLPMSTQPMRVSTLASDITYSH